MATVIESKSRKAPPSKKVTKLCLHCGRTKPLTDYYSNRDWDEQLGKDIWCKDCVNRCTTKDSIREYFWENHREWDERIWEASNKKATALARDEQHRHTAVAVYLEFHIPVQTAAIMLKITNFQSSLSLTTL